MKWLIKALIPETKEKVDEQEAATIEGFKKTIESRRFHRNKTLR